MNKIIISVTNDLDTDQRVLRTCDCFNEMGFEILLIGRELKNGFEINYPFKTKRFKLLFNKGFFFYAEYNLRLFFKLLFNRKALLFANDLDTLLANFLVSKLFRRKLIYDSHEYFTEVPELMKRPRIKYVWLQIEQFILPKLKNVITVNEKIAEIYRSKYHIPVTVVKNVPKINSQKESEPLIQFNGDKKVILYQGALNVGRGLELMIDTMPFLKNHLFVLVGDGDLSDQLKVRVRNKQLEDQVVFMGRLTPDQLINITRQADIGISLEEDMGLNYRYCLPNKVFDYIQAKVPVLTSDLPLLKELLNNFKVGEYLTKRNPESLSGLIERMTLNKIDYQEELKRASGFLNWENEKKVLIEFIKKIE